jgi:ketosteroid isomerase-like protein
MKRLVVFFSVLASVGFLLTSAGDLKARGDDAMIQQKLMQLERDWANAEATNDAATIARIEADDYTYVLGNLNGSKQSDLEDAKMHAFTGTAELTEMKVRVLGDAAIVTGKATLRNATYKGKDVSGDYLFMDVFSNQDGQWKVVASHAHHVMAGM